MVVLVVDDTELAWGDPVDLLLGMDYELTWVRPFKGGGVVFWCVTDLEGDVSDPIPSLSPRRDGEC